MQNIKSVINIFAQLPSLGPTSSRRIILHLLRNKEKLMIPLANSIKTLAEQALECDICGNIDTISPCYICTNSNRNSELLCIVEEIGDLWAFEKGNIYSGLYHILGGTLSALNGIGPEDLNLLNIVDRIKKFNIKEVIIATNGTLEGQVTSHYIIQLIKDLPVKVSRLAFGIPIGGEIDYLDEGTLHAALTARKPIV